MRKWIYAIAAVSIGALSPDAQAQAAYKCDWHSYSEQPCSTRIVRTYDAAADAPRSKTAEVVAHRLPGETSQELALRRHRIALSGSDRDECARLDKKIRSLQDDQAKVQADIDRAAAERDRYRRALER